MTYAWNDTRVTYRVPPANSRPVGSVRVAWFRNTRTTRRALDVTRNGMRRRRSRVSDAPFGSRTLESSDETNCFAQSLYFSQERSTKHITCDGNRCSRRTFEISKRAFATESGVEFPTCERRAFSCTIIAMARSEVPIAEASGSCEIVRTRIARGTSAPQESVRRVDVSRACSAESRASTIDMCVPRTR